MGRLIDADRLKDILEYGILCNVPADAVNTKEEKWNDWVQEVVNKAPTVEAIPKADYEAHLKADMVAMLDNIRAEIIAKDRNVKAVRSDDCCFFTIEEILEILDNYKLELESQEKKNFLLQSL